MNAYAKAEEIAGQISDDAKAFLRTVRGSKLKQTITLNHPMQMTEAFSQALEGAKSLRSAGIFGAPEQLGSDDIRVMHKLKYPWTELGLSVRIELMELVSKVEA